MHTGFHQKDNNNKKEEEEKKRKWTKRTELCGKNHKSHQVKLIITNRPPHPKSQFVLPDKLAHFVVAEMQLDVTVSHLNEKIPGCSLVCLQRLISPPLFPMFGSPAP